jgi:hypothetical protein
VEQVHSGAVQVFYGGDDSLTVAGQHWIEQGRVWKDVRILGTMVGSTPEGGDELGYSLSAGDLDGDGYSDLVLSAPGQTTAAGGDAGSVNVIYGSAAGLDIPGHMWISQGLVIQDDGTEVGALVGTPSGFDLFGQSLTIADFDSNGHDDLVIGIPGYTLAGSSGDEGGVNVIPGSQNGLALSGNQLWTQDGGWDDQGAYLGDLYGSAEDNDRFGGALP